MVEDLLVVDHHAAVHDLVDVHVAADAVGVVEEPSGAPFARKSPSSTSARRACASAASLAFSSLLALSRAASSPWLAFLSWAPLWLVRTFVSCALVWVSSF